MAWTDRELKANERVQIRDSTVQILTNRQYGVHDFESSLSPIYSVGVRSSIVILRALADDGAIA